MTLDLARRAPAAWLLAYVLLIGASHLLWAAWDARPPEWDRAMHMARALQCGDALAAGSWREVLDLGAYYPPLMYCGTGVLHRLLGPVGLWVRCEARCLLLLVLVLSPLAGGAIVSDGSCHALGSSS